MTKYFRYSFDGYSVLDIVSDNLKDFRKELAFLRTLKHASKDSYNPIIETDYDNAELGYEFCRLHNSSIVRVMYRGD